MLFALVVWFQIKRFYSGDISYYKLLQLPPGRAPSNADMLETCPLDIMQCEAPTPTLPVPPSPPKSSNTMRGEYQTRHAKEEEKEEEPAPVTPVKPSIEKLNKRLFTDSENEEDWVLEIFYLRGFLYVSN